MKKINTLFCLAFLFIGFSVPSVLAQTVATETPNNPSNFRNPVWIGLNLGGAWQSSNVPVDHVGFGGGFTVGKNYLTYTDSKFFLGWRFRYLSASTYGQDYNRNYGIKNNQALNGGTDSTLNFVKSGGFVYNNYMMTLHELSLEILAGPNLINKRTGSGPLAYLFGGVGMVQTQTFLDMRDANNVPYNFKGIDTAGTMNKTQIANALSAKMDHTYETAADGSATPTWHFMPSLGIGLGYQVKNFFQVGVEYKVTFAGNVPIDGVQWTQNNTALVSHNKYNYADFFIKFGFGGKHHTHTSGGTDGHVTTDTHIKNPPPPPPPPPPSGARPTIYITYPASNPFQTGQGDGMVAAQIHNVSNANDVQVTVNGMPINSWHFNTADGVFNGDFYLIEGSNTVTITATNAYGIDSKSQYFYYTIIHTTPVEPPPVITITSPVQNPYNTSSNMVAVTAIVNNVWNASEVQLKINGAGSSNFQFDPGSHLMQFTMSLSPGNNYVYILAGNRGGSDSKGLNVIYTPVYYSVPPPIVQFTIPGNTPFLTNLPNGTLSAQIQNVTDPNQILFTVNGQRHMDFSFDPNLGTFNYNPMLVGGNNYYYLSATNATGTDSKSMDIVYTPSTVPAPVVTIQVPYNNPFITSTNYILIRARVDNVNFPNQIQVSMNGSNLNSFVYNLSTRILEFSAPLTNGNTSFVISASNSGGSDSKQLTVEYTQPMLPRPIVNIIYPIGNPYGTSASGLTVNATVVNVTSASQIAVTMNGAPVTNFVYSPVSKALQFEANLNPGNNDIRITATNNGGYDAKSLEAVYTPVVVSPPLITFVVPVNNPFISPMSPLPIKATVMNVTMASQIQVIVNGVNLYGFGFSLSTHTVTFNALLNPGMNTINILAANDGGSDNKNMSVKYVPGSGDAGLPRPIVTFVQPSPSPYTTTVNSVSVEAKVVNVNSVRNIHLQINGATSTNLNFDPVSGKLTFTTPLNPGNNYFILSGTNSTGTDTKTMDVIYNAPVLPKPVIIISNPSGSPFNTALSSFTLNAIVENVSLQSQVKVTSAAGDIPDYVFNPGNGTLSFATTLTPDVNSYTIAATNVSGTTTSTQVVIYTPPAIPKPVVTITNPSSQPWSTHNSPMPVNATVQNVTQASAIKVTVNGSIISGFNFNVSTKALSFSAPLHDGGNMIVVSATNAGGSDSKSVNVEFTNIPPPPPRPIVTITAPTSNPYTTVVATDGVTATVQNVTASNGINVTRNSVSVAFTYDPNSHVLLIHDGLILGQNNFVITATNASGSDTKSTTLMLSSPMTGGGGNGTGTGTHTQGYGASMVPSILVLSPTGAPALASIPNPQVTCSMGGTVAQGDITVKVNGVPFNFGTGYSDGTHTLTFKPNLNPGMNTIEIKIVNTYGTAVRTLNIQYSSFGGGAHH